MEEIHKIEFICPMNCEGNKTYPEQGRCPVCNMRLVPYSPTKDHKHQSLKKSS
jgi:P-type Cu+ transporter